MSDGGYVLCVKYITDDGNVKIMKSDPTNRRIAHRQREEFKALGKGESVWVERVSSAWPHNSTLARAIR